MQISVIRDSACGGSCAACGLCSNSREMTLALKNTLNLSVGNKVRLISDDRKIIRFSATGYRSLTVLLILGAILGGIIGGDWLAFICAVMGTLLGIFILRKVFTKRAEIIVEKIEV